MNSLPANMIGKRFTFTATKGEAAYGIGSSQCIPLLHLKNVKMENQPFQVQAFFACSPKTDALELKEGDQVQFEARVEPKNSSDWLRPQNGPS